MIDNKEYIDFVISKLEPWKHVNNRTVFGGVGLFIGSILFCIIKERTIYMVVSSDSVIKYKNLGSHHFVQGITKQKDYSTLYTLPDSIFVDNSKFIEWSNESYTIARNKILLGENHIE